MDSVLKGENKLLFMAASFVSVTPFAVRLFPYQLPIFAPMVLIFFIAVICYRRTLFLGTWTLLLSLMVFVYILPLILTGNIDRLNIKDFRNIITFFIFFSALYTLIDKKEQFCNFTRYFQIMFVILSTIISCLGLIKWLLLIGGKQIGFFFSARGVYPWGSSLIADYNVFGLGLSFGLISAFFLYRKANSPRLKYLLFICCLLITAAAATAGSRRTWLIIFIIYGFTFANVIIKYLTATSLKLSKYQITNLLLLIMILAALSSNYESISGFFQTEQPVIVEKMWKRFKSLQGIFHGEGGVQTRTKRFEYAAHILNEYNSAQLIFGNGGEYHTQFGQQFSVSSYDKPHNILLSTFLHSGIIGLVIVGVTMFFGLLIYLKNFYFEEVRFFFYIFILLTFIAFSSSDTVFSSKRFFFCMLLPFIINDIYLQHISENKESTI